MGMIESQVVRIQEQDCVSNNMAISLNNIIKIDVKRKSPLEFDSLSLDPNSMRKTSQNNVNASNEKAENQPGKTL